MKRRVFVIDSGRSNLLPVLKEQGQFNIKHISSSDHFMRKAKSFNPNIIVGDFLCHDQEHLINLVREDYILNNTPVILCANNRNLTKMITRINGNVNDYLVVPFETEEAIARIGRVIDRHEKVLNSNPLSHLPGNILIKDHVSQLNKKNEDYALIYLDLDNFKAYNDYYGYSKGDEVIKFVAELCRDSILEKGIENSKSFIGHIGGDDFIVVRSVNEIEEYCQILVDKFDENIKYFYNEVDRDNGFINSFDRQGCSKQFPIMTLSVSVVIKDGSSKMHYGKLSRKGAEIKKFLKALSGSNYLIDRRNHDDLSLFPIQQCVEFA